MNISIFGLGYVGCVATGCLAKLGHTVIGVDSQQTKVDFINQGQPTIVEQSIREIMASGYAAGRISATRSSIDAVMATQVSFVCVGTPPRPNGHLDLSAVMKVGSEIGLALRNKSIRHVIAVRSTVLPGTRDELSAVIEQSSGRKAGVDFAVVSNPEFLREGTSVRDFLNPPYTLLGSESDWATKMMREVYADITAPIIVTVPRIAELMKYVCNSFHALKIAFANEIGSICQELEIDGVELMDIFCRDTKLNISRAYLKPGFAYGGSCLPKDLRALQTIAHDHYLSCPVLESIDRSNEHQKETALQEIQRHNCRKLGVLGLSFKPGTDDLRESPIVDILERLLGKGYDVKIHDPNVHVAKLIGANRDYIQQKIPFISTFISADLQEVLTHAQLVVVVNKEPGVEEALRNLPAEIPVLDLADRRNDRLHLVAEAGASGSSESLVTAG